MNFFTLEMPDRDTRLDRRVSLALVLGVGAALVLSWWWRRPSGPALPELGRVASFTLTNQARAAFSTSSLAGHVWLANVFFTRCPGPCLRVTRTLKSLQDRLPSASTARIVSLTVDAAYDQPEVLRRYARQHGADTNRWVFLTGPQPAIYRAATEQLHLAAAENPEPEKASPADLFIHSTRVVLVDQTGMRRGVFDGEDTNAIPRLLAAIQSLETHPPAGKVPSRSAEE